MSSMTEFIRELYSYTFIDSESRLGIQSNRLAIETRFDTSEPEHNPIFTAGFQQVTFNENLPNQELCGVL